MSPLLFGLAFAVEGYRSIEDPGIRLGFKLRIELMVGQGFFSCFRAGLSCFSSFKTEFRIEQLLV